MNRDFVANCKYLTIFEPHLKTFKKTKQMKKITILAVAALAISFASCKKARTCTCTVTYTYSETHTDSTPASSGSGTWTEASVTTTKLAKKAAKGTCASGKTVDTQVITTTGDTETQIDTYDRACTLK